MAAKEPDNVSSAFEMLLEEIRSEIDSVNRLGAQAFQSSNYEKANKALQRSSLLSEFGDKVAALNREWRELSVAPYRPIHSASAPTRRTDGKKLPRGQRTPQTAYYVPILQVLQRLGGRGRAAQVLEGVGRIMKPVLKDVDLEPLASTPNMPRWRNTAQWARNDMVREGLLKRNLPKGIWEMTDEGRTLLERLK